MSTAVKWHKWGVWLLMLLLFTVLAALGARTILSRAHGPYQLLLYGSSTQEEAFSQGILPAFEQAWEADHDGDLQIEAVFGPSGTLARQIMLGAPADVAILSNPQHVTWLQVGRRVGQDSPFTVIGCTPMVIVTRPGNPEGISDFADLSRPGLQLVHAEPVRSGAGDWSLLAEYGSAWLDSNDRETSRAQVKAIWQNVRLMADSGRAALTLFELGAGDALVTYEQDARLAESRKVDVDIVMPRRSVIALHLAVIVDDNVTRAERPIVEAFVSFLLSDPGQSILRQYHLRPAQVDAESFTRLADPFLVEALGGWSAAYDEVIEGIWLKEIFPTLDIEAPTITAQFSQLRSKSELLGEMVSVSEGE